ncbi:hypothetical protein V2J09_005901 [Rumex salicifolius]
MDSSFKQDFGLGGDKILEKPPVQAAIEGFGTAATIVVGDSTTCDGATPSGMTTVGLAEAMSPWTTMEEEEEGEGEEEEVLVVHGGGRRLVTRAATRARDGPVDPTEIPVITPVPVGLVSVLIRFPKPFN